MRVLQLIDSLRPGGAEQMAVAYANALARKGVNSYLCCTRMEGLLKKRLEPAVGYLFLEKKFTLDSRAYFKLKDFVKENKIQIIQAHSSSFFLATLIKLSLPNINLIWHDHHGERAMKNKSPGLLKPASFFFKEIISANRELAEWARIKLHSQHVSYIKNFLPDIPISADSRKLKGKTRFKIICVASFRREKDHLNLLKAFHRVLMQMDQVSLHLIGKDYKDAYSEQIIQFINAHEMTEKVFLYGEQENIEGLIQQATIGVLSSSSEGLPVSLLEYGRAGIPSVCTQVGEIPNVVGSYGQVVVPENPEALAEGIIVYIENEIKRKEDASEFKKKVLQEFSEKVVILQVIDLYKEILGSYNGRI